MKACSLYPYIVFPCSFFDENCESNSTAKYLLKVQYHFPRCYFDKSHRWRHDNRTLTRQKKKSRRRRAWKCLTRGRGDMMSMICHVIVTYQIGRQPRRPKHPIMTPATLDIQFFSLYVTWATSNDSMPGLSCHRF